MASGPLKGPRQLHTVRDGGGEKEAAEAHSLWDPRSHLVRVDLLSTDFKSVHAREAPAIRRIPPWSGEMKDREREGQTAQTTACVCERGRNPGL